MFYSEFQHKRQPKASGVYVITNTLNCKQYVGMSVDIFSRWRSHAIMKGGCRALYAAINKYGIDVFDFTILEHCSDRLLLPLKEVEYIDKLQTLSPLGYNLTVGGEGVVPTDEIREEHSKRMKAKWQDSDYREAQMLSLNSVDHKENQSQISTERWKDISHRELCSRRIKESLNTPETKARISEAQLRLWENPEHREKMALVRERVSKDVDVQARKSQSMKEKWSDPAYKDRLSAKLKEVANSPGMKEKKAALLTEEYIANCAKTMKTVWENPKVKVHMFFRKRNSGYIPTFEEGWEIALLKGVSEDMYEYARSYYSAKYPSILSSGHVETHDRCTPYDNLEDCSPI